MAFGGILLAKAEATPESARPARCSPGRSPSTTRAQGRARRDRGREQQGMDPHRYLARHAEPSPWPSPTSSNRPAKVPAEFFDTLGSIQEATSQPRKAEESYEAGLEVDPNHPTLNYHLGKLLLADPNQSARAASHLRKALAGRARLAPEMAKDLDGLVKTVSPWRVRTEAKSLLLPPWEKVPRSSADEGSPLRENENLRGCRSRGPRPQSLSSRL